MSSKVFAIKRITKDLKEIQNNPVEGVGICQLDPNDPFQLLVNIQIQQGRYKDMLVHILLFLPEQYPCKPPRMLILPGQPYDHSFHHHIYPEYDGYFKFCIDLLDAAIMNSNAIGSGWSPGYTFCTLLMQIQNFLADPDFHSKSEELSDAQIKAIHEKLKGYSYTHSVNGKQITHSTKQPYPPLQKRKQETAKPDLQSSLMLQVKERISCFMTKENIIENPTGIYGYPVFVQKDKFNRLQQKAVPEVLSYEGFKSQLDQFGLKTISFTSQFKTGMGEAYNGFIPIFLNKQHFEQSKKVLAQSLEQISSEQSFELQVLQVLPNLINKMLVALLNDSMHQSISAIEAYVHFTQLFHYLIEDNASLRQEIDQRVRSMIQNDRARSKQQLGDIGEFLVILSGSKYALTPELLNLLYREYYARQIFWIPKGQFYNSYLSATTIPKKLDSIFQSAIVSNKLLIFNIEASEKFAENKEYLRKLAEERYSVISETEAEDFIKQTKETIKKINTHTKLMDYLGLGGLYRSDEDCYNQFKIAIFVSNSQKYSNFNLQLKDNKNGKNELEIQGDTKQPFFSEKQLISKSEYHQPPKKVQEQPKQQQQTKATNSKKDVEEEEQKREQHYSDSDSEQEDEWHTVSDSKNPSKKDEEKPRKLPQPVLSNKPQTKTELPVQKQQTQQKNKTSTVVTQQPVQTKINNNDDDGWSVVSDKKKKN